MILSLDDLELYRDDGLCGDGLDAADAAYAGAYAAAAAYAAAYAEAAEADAAYAAARAGARVRNEIIEMVVAACEAATP